MPATVPAFFIASGFAGVFDENSGAKKRLHYKFSIISPVC